MQKGHWETHKRSIFCILIDYRAHRGVRYQSSFSFQLRKLNPNKANGSSTVHGLTVAGLRLEFQVRIYVHSFLNRLRQLLRLLGFLLKITNLIFLLLNSSLLSFPSSLKLFQIQLLKRKPTVIKGCSHFFGYQRGLKTSYSE